MKPRPRPRRQPQSPGWLTVLIGVLLLVPLLFVAALLAIAGPSTRAVVAGDLSDNHDGGSTVRLASVEAASRPLDGHSPATDVDGLDPDAEADRLELFRPRLGTLGLEQANAEGSD